jgi:hypothetical protein
MKRQKTYTYSMVVGLGLAAVSASLAGCKKSAPPAGPAGSASAAAAEAPKVDPTPPPGADPDLYKALATVVEKCNINVNDATASCPGEEARKLGDEFSSGKRSRAGAIKTFTLMLESKNENLRAAAVSVMHSGLRNGFGEDVKPGDVKPEDAQALLKDVFELPKPYIRRALPAAVHASVLANQLEPLYAKIDPAKDPDAAGVGIRYLMTHGRLTTFPKVQELTKASDTRLALSAIEAVQNMEKWTPEEQKVLCPWTTDFLSDKRPSVAARAATALSNCGGEFLDQILASGEKALKDGEFSSARLSGLRMLCTPSRRAQPNAPTAAQCDRTRNLLEKVIQTPKLEVSTRSSALVALTNQWNDPRTVAFVKKLQAGKDEGLTDQLKTAMRRLERKDGAKDAKDPKDAKEGGEAPIAKPAAPAASVKSPG